MKPPKGGFFIYFEFRDREIFVNIKKILKGCLIDLKRSWTVLLVVVLPMVLIMAALPSVSYTHLRAHETLMNLVCRLLLEKTIY